jgi:hypothetical protein
MNNLRTYKEICFFLPKEEPKIASEFDVSLPKAFCEAQIPLSKINPAIDKFMPI